MSEMQCPKCSAEMMVRQKNETTIDYCPSCGGVWLDKGEIDKIIEIQSKGAHMEPPMDNSLMAFLELLLIRKVSFM